MSEYKKAKQDLKKATAETNKWQKKVKKGELGEHDKYLLHLTIILTYLLSDPGCLTSLMLPITLSLSHCKLFHLYHGFQEETKERSS